MTHRSRVLASAAAVLLAATALAHAQTVQPDPRRDDGKNASQRKANEDKADQNPVDQNKATDSQRRDTQPQQKNATSPSNIQKSSSSTSPSNDKSTSSSGDKLNSPSSAQSSTPSSPSTAKSSTPTPSSAQSTDKSTSSSPSNGRSTSPSATAQSVQPNSAQSPSTAASVQLNTQQQTRISSVISSQRIAPVTSVNFTISVGTVVPRTVSVHTLPAEIVTIVPQYRGYSYFVTREQIVIVEPSTYRIVTVLPYNGGAARAQAVETKTSKSKLQFTSAQREVIKKQVVQRPARSTTTNVTIGETVPETVEIEEFPETVYREVPDIRAYRYYRTDRNVVVVDPADRHVIEIIE